jgi:hypothetical protein
LPKIVSSPNIILLYLLFAYPLCAVLAYDPNLFAYARLCAFVLCGKMHLTSFRSRETMVPDKRRGDRAPALLFFSRSSDRASQRAVRCPTARCEVRPYTARQPEDGSAHARRAIAPSRRGRLARDLGTTLGIWGSSGAPTRRVGGARENVRELRLLVWANNPRPHGDRSGKSFQILPHSAPPQDRSVHVRTRGHGA